MTTNIKLDENFLPFTRAQTCLEEAETRLGKKIVQTNSGKCLSSSGFRLTSEDKTAMKGKLLATLLRKILNFLIKATSKVIGIGMKIRTHPT